MISKAKIIFGVILTLLFLTLIHSIVKNTFYQRELHSLKIQSEARRNESIKLTKDREKKSLILSDQQKEINSIDKISDKLLSIDEFNLFVKSFESIRKRYPGVNKVGYELLEDEGRATINLTYVDTYNNIKKFIYEVEQTFFFLDISYIKMERDSYQVKGNMSIQIFFRSNDDEG